MSASHAPAIASRGQVQGGRMDGTQGYVIDSRDTLLMVVAYKHPKTGALVADSRASVSNAAAARILREMADRFDPQSTDSERAS